MGSSVNNNGDVEFEGGIDRFVIGSGRFMKNGDLMFGLD